MDSANIVIIYTRLERDFPGRTFKLEYPSLNKAKRAVAVLVTKNPHLTVDGRAINPTNGAFVRVQSGTTFEALFSS